MERVAADVEGFHFGVGDLDALLIGPLIERTLDLEPGFGRRRGDQLDHCSAADEWVGGGEEGKPVIGVDVSPPSFCTSPSHTRERAWWTPPQSAVIISSRMLV